MIIFLAIGDQTQTSKQKYPSNGCFSEGRHNKKVVNIFWVLN